MRALVPLRVAPGILFAALAGSGALMAWIGGLGKRSSRRELPLWPARERDGRERTCGRTTDAHGSFGPATALASQLVLLEENFEVRDMAQNLLGG